MTLSGKRGWLLCLSLVCGLCSVCCGLFVLPLGVTSILCFVSVALPGHLYIFHLKQMTQRITKPIKWHVRPAKTQISLGIRPVWSESSLSAWSKFGSLATHWVHSKESDQTGRMSRLIGVFAGRTYCRFCHPLAQICMFWVIGQKKGRVGLFMVPWLF